MSKSKKNSKKPQAGRRPSTRVQQQQEQDPPLNTLPRTIWNMPRLLLLLLIRLYQETLSKGVPANTCRFHPTCSHYGYQAIYKYGVLKGGWLATWRVLRCNPFNHGGYDPVP
jgi:putative membrane protein insertion efficiency factor